LINSSLRTHAFANLFAFDTPGIRTTISPTRPPSVLRGPFNIRRLRLKIVQKEKHRGMFRRSDDEIAEVSQRVFAKYIAFVGRNIPANNGFPSINVEMILPKIDHYFLKLPFRINRTQNTIRG